MMDILRAEMLKYKRTFMAKLVIFIPLFFAAYSLATTYLIPGSYDWNGILVLSFNWWPVTFLPLGYGLFAGMAADQERRAGNWRTLRTETLAPQRIWLAKIGVLFAGDLLCGALQGSVQPQATLLVAALFCWLATLALIPLQLWLATWAGMLASIAFGALGMIIGVLLAPTKLWLLCPWSWATRLMCPTIGVHPNGIVLPAGDPLLDAGVIPVGLAVALAAFAALSVLTAQWFAERESR